MKSRNYNSVMVAGVILAAGRSARMGFPKASLPHPPSGTSFLVHLIRTSHSAGLSPAFVVARRGDLGVAEIVRAEAGTLVFNEDPDAGGQLASDRKSVV